MNTKSSKVSSLAWGAFALAGITAIAYLLIALGVLGVGDAHGGNKEAVIIYVAAGCYLLGGSLILLRRKWLLVLGALINALVMVFFFTMYKTQPDVVFSAGGLATKIPQILLELALIFMIFTKTTKPATLKS